jgi:serine O-acetyltransferase
MSSEEFVDFFYDEHFKLNTYLDSDWIRLHEFGGIFATKRKFIDCISPRFAPVVLIRLAHWYFVKGHFRLAKFISLLNFIIFGLEVPARLHIGFGLVIPHTHGTIIGAGYVGNNVTIYQQVTLGAKLADFGYEFNLRPKIADNVIITAGAKILGPVTLGEGCVIGANAVVIRDVPPNTLAVGIPAQIKRKNIHD